MNPIAPVALTRAQFETTLCEQADGLMLFLRCSVRGDALVDDVFQETMLVAWRNRERFDGGRQMGPWLRGIAMKLILAHRRKLARTGVVCDEDLLERFELRMRQLESLPGDNLEDRLAALRECLQGLPEPYRQAIHARYMEQLLGEQLAARLAITLENAKKRLQRGRDRLLQCLNRKLEASGEV